MTNDPQPLINGLTRSETAPPEEPDGCGWQGRAFGSNYPDGCCIGGMLWDLDSCDEPGGGLTSGGDRSCPNCNPEGCADDMEFSGNARQRRTQRKAAIREIHDQAKEETQRWAR